MVRFTEQLTHQATKLFMAKKMLQAPKPKKAKKTKQQLEEERKQAEEATRLAEEGSPHETCTEQDLLIGQLRRPASFQSWCSIAVKTLTSISNQACGTSIERYNAYTLRSKCQCQMQTCSVGAERLRLEAEEQARKAAEEEKRQELIQLQTEREDARLASER